MLYLMKQWVKYRNMLMQERLLIPYLIEKYWILLFFVILFSGKFIIKAIIIACLKIICSYILHLRPSQWISKLTWEKTDYHLVFPKDLAWGSQNFRAFIIPVSYYITRSLYSHTTIEENVFFFSCLYTEEAFHLRHIEWLKQGSS